MSRIAVNKIANRLKTKEITVDSIIETINFTAANKMLGPVKPEWFGAVADNFTDSTEALEAAFNTGREVILSGKYVASRRINRTGGLRIRGFSPDFCGIRWPSTSNSVGINANPTNLNEYIVYEGVDLVCESTATPTESFIKSSWAGLTGYSTYTYFTTKFVMRNSMVRCLNGGLAETMVEVLDLYGALLQHVHIFGSAKRYFVDSNESYQTIYGFRASNDATASNTVGMKLYDVHVYYCRESAWLDDVEGVEIDHVDFQACWNGLTINNSIRRINQYRITNSHFGTNNTALKAINCRHLLTTSNEFSWGSNRTNSATIQYIVLNGCEDPHILGNTIRGNAAVGTYGHNITGISLGTDATSGTLRSIIDNNTFRSLTTGVNQDANSNSTIIGLQNNWVDVSNRFINNAGSNGVPPLRYGQGALVNPTGVGPLMLLTGIGQSGLAINRDANGSMQTFHVAGAAASGVISSSATSTSYGTTSDATLKDDLGELPLEDCIRIIEALTFHRWNWKSNGELDEGLFAQELYKIYPKAVYVGGWKNEFGETVEEGTDGANYEAWSVDYSKLIVPIGRCMQDVLKRTTDIENRILKLETK